MLECLRLRFCCFHWDRPERSGTVLRKQAGNSMNVMVMAVIDLHSLTWSLTETPRLLLQIKEGRERQKLSRSNSMRKAYAAANEARATDEEDDLDGAVDGRTASASVSECRSSKRYRIRGKQGAAGGGAMDLFDSGSGPAGTPAVAKVEEATTTVSGQNSCNSEFGELHARVTASSFHVLAEARKASRQARRATHGNIAKFGA